MSEWRYHLGDQKSVAGHTDMNRYIQAALLNFSSGRQGRACARGRSLDRPHTCMYARAHTQAIHPRLLFYQATCTTGTCTSANTHDKAHASTSPKTSTAHTARTKHDTHDALLRRTGMVHVPRSCIYTPYWTKMIHAGMCVRMHVCTQTVTTCRYSKVGLWLAL